MKFGCILTCLWTAFQFVLLLDDGKCYNSWDAALGGGLCVRLSELQGGYRLLGCSG